MKTNLLAIKKYLKQLKAVFVYINLSLQVYFLSVLEINIGVIHENIEDLLCDLYFKKHLYCVFNDIKDENV